MGDFQKQERVWRTALDRARLLSLFNFGLSPFLYWWNKVPANTFFLVMVLLMVMSALLFLGSVNLVLRRLGAMLPDEALRLETRQFTALNLNLLFATFVLALLYVGLGHFDTTAVLAGRGDECGGTRQPVVSDLAGLAAPGHDHGAALEDQGGHPRQRVQRQPVSSPATSEAWNQGIASPVTCPDAKRRQSRC